MEAHLKPEASNFENVCRLPGLLPPQGPRAGTFVPKTGHDTSRRRERPRSAAVSAECDVHPRVPAAPACARRLRPARPRRWRHQLLQLHSEPAVARAARGLKDPSTSQRLGVTHLRPQDSSLGTGAPSLTPGPSLTPSRPEVSSSGDQQPCFGHTAPGIWGGPEEGRKAHCLALERRHSRGAQARLRALAGRWHRKLRDSTNIWLFIPKAVRVSAVYATLGNRKTRILTANCKAAEKN